MFFCDSVYNIIDGNKQRGNLYSSLLRMLLPLNLFLKIHQH